MIFSNFLLHSLIMAMLRTFLMSLAVTVVLFKLAMAENYTVGVPNGGWDMTTDIQTWATSKSFLVGDNLIFRYAPSHDVLEVSKVDYDSCQASNPLQAYSGGTTVIPLSSTGKRYFLCGTSGHCSQGMKVEIDTLATSTPPSASPTSPPPPASLVNSSLSSPPPETSTFSPAQLPEFTPASSPSSPPIALLSNPTSPPATGPSATASLPPPPPSSANKESFLTNLTMGFSLVMVTLLAF